jgi:uncharacterized membrane protein (UPF0127 family)
MSVSDRIAKRLIKYHSDLLGISKIAADGWNISIDDLDDTVPLKYEECFVGLGKDARIVVKCQIANTTELQVIGLQKHSSLAAYDGMVFPYNPPRRVGFHMASVRFPIDIIFVGSDRRISRIVDNIEPGSPGRWYMPHTAAVIEVNGGFCRAHGLSVGDDVCLVEPIVKGAQEEFPNYPRRDINPQMVRDPDRNPEYRFKGHDLPDKFFDYNPMDSNYMETEGVDAIRYHDDDGDIAPVRPSL